MKLTSAKTLTLLFLTLLTMGISACGQKGPLEVERPQVIQEEEPEETR